MARARIGIGSGGVNRLKGAVAKASGAKPTGRKAKAASTFVGLKAKSKAKVGRNG